MEYMLYNEVQNTRTIGLKDQSFETKNFYKF